jgi:branched-chain amino acid aminotransferase
MDECIGKVYSLDGKLENAESFSAHYHGSPGSIYEVIRVMDGIPLFLDDHMDRMELGMRLTRTWLPSTRIPVIQAIHEVVQANQLKNGNIKVVCQEGETGRQLFVFVTAHQYPVAEQYKSGIPAVLMHASRNIPNAKQSDPHLSDRAREIRLAEGVHEVLFVDEQSCITEGSRSNVFFVRDGEVLTPPVTDVLPGITRKYIIECCRQKQIPFRETRIRADELSGMGAAFLSSTSRRVLPVNRIGDLGFPPGHPIVREIQHGFNNIVTVYLLGTKLARME